MKRVHDLYGFEIDDLELARTLVEAALGLTLAPHESVYWGGNYYRWEEAEEEGERFVLRRNFNEFENAYEKEEFSNAKILLHVSRPRDPERIRSALTSKSARFVHLEREES